MSYEYIGYMATFAVGSFVLLLIVLVLIYANQKALDALFKSLGGWKAMMKYREWKKNKEVYFVDDRNKWIDQARIIVRNNMMEPESHYSEIAIQSLCDALAEGKLNMPSPLID